MTYEEFKDLVVDEIKDYLPGDYMDAGVAINQVVKNNETLDGLTITKKDQNVSPTIYLNSFYENYQDGRDIEDILKSIAELRANHDAPSLLSDIGFSVEDIQNYDAMKERLIAHVVGIDGNEELLNKRPHVVKQDMAIMYKISINDEMSIPVTNDIFNGYGISLEDFHEKAMSNVHEHICVKSMSETIAEMMGVSADEIPPVPPEKDMLIITNDSKVNGAIGIFDEKLMDELSERYGNILILPSSIHESLIVPESAGLTEADALQMVIEVNSTQVAPQDKLTDSVYRYDRESHEIVIARDEPEIERDFSRELYHDRNISITEAEVAITIANNSETEIGISGSKLADTLGYSKDEAVVVLEAGESLSWENSGKGFTGEVVDALKTDIATDSIKSFEMDQARERKMKIETPAVALA